MTDLLRDAVESLELDLARGWINNGKTAHNVRLLLSALTARDLEADHQRKCAQEWFDRFQSATTRTTTLEAQVVRLTGALEVWAKAFDTGRSEPLYVARDHAARIVWRAALHENPDA